ncbi:hypothetical protein BC835DRAFT_98912 [Cytidiella melzeri]|nr:hypothetical protein BC835DRAFT_98912 [Cytidiella melzeri]
MSSQPPYGEPRKAPKPQPMGNFAMLFLFTTCTICALFLLWRRASSVRMVVAHRLQEWTGNEGGIRLSIEDGPSAREFIDDEEDEDTHDMSDEPLPAHLPNITAAGVDPHAGLLRSFGERT